MSTTFLRSRCTLGVRDVSHSIDFYREALGFELVTTMGEPPQFALIARDRVGLGLVRVDSPHPEGFACCYFDLEGVESLFRRCVEAGATITNPLTRQPWGNYDFVVRDPDGHQIALGEAPDHG